MVTTLVGSLIILVAFFIAVAIFLHFVPLGLWISAMAAGSSVGIFTLIGMRLRRVPPGQIVMPLIKANKAGLDINVKPIGSALSGRRQCRPGNRFDDRGGPGANPLVAGAFLRD